MYILAPCIWLPSPNVESIIIIIHNNKYQIQGVLFEASECSLADAVLLATIWGQAPVLLELFV